MAGRLISPPLGLPVISLEPLSGPRTVGSGATQAISGFTQTSGAAFGLWRWRVAFAPMLGSRYRRHRGWITSLHGGANATRWSFWDPDLMGPREAGIAVPKSTDWTSNGYDRMWSNGKPWSNGRGWGMSPPTVPVTLGSSREASIVSLGSVYWGHDLDIGDLFGFFPFHFGLYMVTQVFEPGTYRIWPPLRKALTVGNFATLRPVLVMRLEGEDAATVGRGLFSAEGLTVTMVEVLDYDVREYFAATD